MALAAARRRAAPVTEKRESRFICERLLVVDHTRSGFTAGDWLYEWVRKMFNTNSEYVTTPKRIYIRRAPAQRRRLVNESEIEKLLVNKGFTVISPEQLGILKSFEILTNCESVISPHGAGLANIVASDKLKSVGELHGAHCSVEFWFTGSAAGAKHFTLGGASLNMNTKNREIGPHKEFVAKNGADFTLEPLDLANFVDQILN